MIIITQMLENQIALLKKCVEFYSDESNHIYDKGHVARETLKSVESLEEQHKQFNTQYSEYLNSGEQEHKSPDDIAKEIQNLINKIN